MKIDEYLALYSEYRKRVIDMAKTIDFIKARTSDSEVKTLFEIKDCCDVATKRLEERFERKKRILGRATRRLKRAIDKMENADEVMYLTCRYIYFMDIEDIASAMRFSTRQVYRLGAKAKEHIFEKLLEEMPKAKRTLRSIYKRKGISIKKSYRKNGRRLTKREVSVKMR